MNLLRSSFRLIGVGILGLVAGLSPSTAPSTFSVQAGEEVQLALDAAPPGSTIVLGPGRHRGPITISRSVALRGEAGAEVFAPLSADAAVTVTADGVSMTDLVIRGGWTGVDLIKADGATLRRLSVVGSDLQGIRVYARSALVEDVTVAHMVDPHAQGIEVLSAPDVTVRRSLVVGGKIGIVAHLSDVGFESNQVTGTSLAGVVIREMSRGSATGNVVDRAAGAGLYCGDMSVCSFRDNLTAEISAADNSRSGAGWGLVVHYRSSASIEGDVLEGDAGRTVVLADSRLTAERATRTGSGAGAIWPALGSSLVSIAIGGGLYLLVTKRQPLMWRRQATPSATILRIAAPMILVFLAVQSFHMLEHVIQLVRVHGRGVPGEGGLAGQVVDNEWAHFAYNSAVLVGMGSIAWLRSRGWATARARGADRLLFAAGIVQAYHVVEHTTKLVQHVGGGVKVAPGLLGTRFDLVYLHFGINAAVYLGFLGASLLYLWRSPEATRRARPLSLVQTS